MSSYYENKGFLKAYTKDITSGACQGTFTIWFRYGPGYDEIQAYRRNWYKNGHIAEIALEFSRDGVSWPLDISGYGYIVPDENQSIEKSMKDNCQAIISRIQEFYTERTAEYEWIEKISFEFDNLDKSNALLVNQTNEEIKV